MQNSSPLPQFQPSGPVVVLDGEQIELPQTLQSYLLAIQAHIESIALRKGRILDAVNFSAQTRQAPVTQEGPVDPGQWEQLGRYFLKTLLRQVGDLQNKLEKVVLLVVVNDWEVVERLWAELQHELRAAVLTLRLLQEFGGSLNFKQEGSPECLSQHFRDLHQAWQALDVAAGGRDNLHFSNELDLRLQPWLDRLLSQLKSLDEDEAVK